MTTTPPTPAQQAARLLRRLIKGMDDRRSLPGGAAREKLDDHLVAALEELASLQVHDLVTDIEIAPPRQVATAMAMALYSHPHLQILFGDQAVDATEPVPQPPLPNADWPIVFQNENLTAALGLEDWTLEDLREEVDRRAGRVMKQTRALDWLWMHFGLPDTSPEPLFRVLFPGAAGRMGPVGLVRRGPQLYALVDQTAPPPPRALFLPWTEVDEERGFRPVGAFRGRYVDKGLRRALGRSVGAGDEEVIELLDRMVTVVPRHEAVRFLVHDHYRARAHAGIAELGSPYSQGAWLTAALQADDVPFSEWLSVEHGQAVAKNAKAAFDQLALPRVTEMLRQLHAELLARLVEDAPVPEGAGRFCVADLELYDLERHIRAVLRPLFDWVAADRTAAHVAEALGVSEAEAKTALAGVATSWAEQAGTVWAGPPQKGRPRSVQAILTSHVLQTQCALRALWSHPADPRWDHRDLLVLFAAHYHAEIQAHRIWADGLSETGAPVDNPLAHWFWGAWNRLLETLDTEAATFSGPFELDL